MNIIDLFAGAGGMSLGFEMAGFRVAWANEVDEWAGDTYTFNHPNTRLIRGDIREIDSWSKVLSNEDEPIVGIVGGPPCQAVSLCGKRDLKDPRNSLFMDFVRCVREVRPSFFVMENVLGLLSMKTKDGEPFPAIIKAALEELSYDVSVTKADASFQGVPQARMRVFIVGFRKDIPHQTPVLHAAVDRQWSVMEAISDLPAIGSGEGTDGAQPYPCAPMNAYQSWAREGSPAVMNHMAMKHTQRLLKRFHAIGPGQSSADVARTHGAVKRGNPGEKSEVVYGQNNQRPRGDKPCPTLPASFQSSFVHPVIDRNFTAREAARIQSFPDRYVFKGDRTAMSWVKKLSQYNQIGNAVPPLLAMAVAEAVKTSMQGD